MTQEGYDAAKQWLSKYDPEAFKAFAKETSQDGFTFVTFVNNRLKTCPLCLGDCDAANPPVLDCPMRNVNLDPVNS